MPASSITVQLNSVIVKDTLEKVSLHCDKSPKKDQQMIENINTPRIFYQNNTEEPFAQLLYNELNKLSNCKTGKLLLSTLQHLQNILSIINNNISTINQQDFAFDYIDPNLYVLFLDSASEGSCFQYIKKTDNMLTRRLNININLNATKLPYDENLGFFCYVQALKEIKNENNQIFGVTGCYKDPFIMLLAHEIIHATHYIKDSIRNFIILLCENKKITLESKINILNQIQQYLKKTSEDDFCISNTLLELKKST